MHANETTPDAPGAMDGIRDTIRGIVLELAPGSDPPAADDARLIEDLEYHSVGLMELAFTLEDEFDLMPIDEATGRSIQTIRDVQDHVVRELQARAAAAT